MLAGTAVGVVIVLVLVLVIVKALAPAKKNAATTNAASAVATAVATVPASTFDAVGLGTPNNLPTPITGQPALTADGKPLVLYVGGEFCPYCAAERWALAAALSRFGTFGNLQQTASSENDVFPGTQTLSFHGATYTSDYVAFQGVEAEDVNQQQLQPLTAAQQATFTKYNSPPFVPQGAAGAFPFIDFGNIAVQNGASYDAGLLQGMSGEDIANALHDPTSPVAKAAIGTANAFTTLICKMTGGKPADVCTSAGATAYQGKYGG